MPNVLSRPSHNVKHNITLQVDRTLAKNLTARFEQMQQPYAYGKDLTKSYRHVDEREPSVAEVITIESSDDDNRNEYYTERGAHLSHGAASHSASFDGESETEDEKSFDIDDDQIDELR